MKKTNSLMLDPLAQTFVNILTAKGGTPIYKLSIKDARKVLSDIQAEPIATMPTDSEDRTIAVGPKGSVAIRIIRPHGNKKVLPAIIYMHGGGWILGDKATHDRLVREIAHGAQAAVIFVDYTRAPEGQYPLAHEEGYAVAQWAAENSAALHIDNARMAIAGDSVGGLMATAIAMMAQERGTPKFIFQLLLYPATDANLTTSSYNEFAQGPWLTKAAMEWFWDNYVPDKKIRSHALVSPLQASLAQLKQLPPTFIMTNEYDVLRDEAEAYAHKLMQAGVAVVAVRYLGIIHDSLMLNPLANVPAVRAAIAQANHMLTNVFYPKK